MMLDNLQGFMDDLWKDVPQAAIDDILYKCQWLNDRIVQLYGITLGARIAISFFLGV